MTMTLVISTIIGKTLAMRDDLFGHRRPRLAGPGEEMIGSRLTWARELIDEALRRRPCLRPDLLELAVLLRPRLAYFGARTFITARQLSILDEIEQVLGRSRTSGQGGLFDGG